jgi:hypothetical protein
MTTENIHDDTVLGYRDYEIDRKTRKDFTTLDAVVDWIEGLWDDTTDTTKEFWDFAEQEYGIQAIIDRMKEKYPGFPYHGDRSQALLEKEIRMYFDRRDLQMKASQFTDTEIPQIQSPE